MLKAGFIIFLFTSYFALLTACDSKQTAEDRQVYVTYQEGRYVLIRNGAPFYIRGANGTVQLSQLHAIGGNTIRTYDTLGLAQILDDAHSNGLAVIAGLPMIRSYHYNTYYRNDSLVDAQLEAFRQTVRRYRSHPALLMWCVGNELNFTFGPKYNHFYAALRDVVDMVHEEDPDHPLTTTIQSFGESYVANIKLYVPDIDIISINTFGKIRSLQEDLKKYTWFWDGPYILTEWGVNGHWETDSTLWGTPIEEPSAKKAEFIREIYTNQIQREDQRCLGSLVFYWGSRQEKTDTWYPLITDDGLTSQSVDELRRLWTGTEPANHAPVVEYLLLDERGARDNIMLRSGENYEAEAVYSDPDGDSLSIEWYIYAENWYKPTFDHEKEIVPIKEIKLAVIDNKVSFNAPDLKGAYRIAVKVFDGQGHFGTANIPFYVTD